MLLTSGVTFLALSMHLDSQWFDLQEFQVTLIIFLLGLSNSFDLLGFLLVAIGSTQLFTVNTINQILTFLEPFCMTS